MVGGNSSSLAMELATLNSKTPHRIWFHSENGPALGGSDYYLGRLIDGLDPTQWQVALLARPHYPLAQISAHPQRISHIVFGPELRRRTKAHGSETVVERPVDLPPRPGIIRQLWSATPRSWRRDYGLLSDIGKLMRLMRVHRPALIHSADGGAQPVVIAAARLGIPTVLGYSAPPPNTPSRGLLRRWEQQSFAAAHVRITKSNFARDDWARYLNRSPEEFTVIPNGIDCRPFDNIEALAARRALGLPHTSLIIGMTARIEPEKGIHVFLEAARLLAEQNEQLHFVITGDGGALNDARCFVNAHRLSSRVTFLGHQENIPLVTSAYDIAIVPSVWNEPFGWTVLEAMAAGKPVVATRVGGIPEIVAQDETGLLVTRSSPTELQIAIQRLVNDADLRRRLGNNGRTQVQHKFSQQKMLEQTYQLYYQLLGDPRRRSLEMRPTSARELTCGTR